MNLTRKSRKFNQHLKTGKALISYSFISNTDDSDDTDKDVISLILSIRVRYNFCVFCVGLKVVFLCEILSLGLEAGNQLWLVGELGVPNCALRRA